MSVVFLGTGGLLALGYLTQIARAAASGGSWSCGLTARVLTKTGATLGLLVTGWLGAAPMLIILGLGLGAAGDFCLVRRGPSWLLAGMAAFAAGHLAYAAAFWGWAAPSFVDTAGTGQILPLALLGAALLPLGLWLSAHAGALRRPVMGYTLLIGLMAVAALILPASAGRGLIWGGVALFLLSDGLLAVRLFVAGPALHTPLDLAVWPSYWLGQALILWGSLLSWGAAAA